ncbi:response regulator transcription factor [Geobacter sp. DSM 9736]|uniref:response regulator n=1 Tax=Geobacter sp. DSM 9736 TaxID=1277350 RepID=UPI000B5083F9|nr:response regulator transcription factor [Geobacter sp. DSM 9736]SNB46538.1 two component transcriptional regulator, LuxR family [Geobacter sp. DSM 9736]
MSITVLLAEDHRIVREGIRSLLEKEQELLVVAEAENGQAALREALRLRPDIVVLDLTMPDMNGIEATRRLVADVPGTRVIVLTMHSDKRFVSEALRAGAHGYVLKESAAEELVAAIRAVADGKRYLCRTVTGVVINNYIERSPAQGENESAFSVLTPREREVLQMVAEGKSTKEIAFAFKVSVKTVETQRQQIMKKLRLYTVADLTKYAIREGITSLH